MPDSTTTAAQPAPLTPDEAKLLRPGDTLTQRGVGEHEVLKVLSDGRIATYYWSKQTQLDHVSTFEMPGEAVLLAPGGATLARLRPEPRVFAAGQIFFDPCHGYSTLAGPNEDGTWEMLDEAGNTRFSRVEESTLRSNLACGADTFVPGPVVRPGQTWRNTSDGTLVVVSSVHVSPEGRTVLFDFIDERPGQGVTEEEFRAAFDLVAEPPRDGQTVKHRFQGRIGKLTYSQGKGSRGDVPVWIVEFAPGDFVALFSVVAVVRGFEVVAPTAEQIVAAQGGQIVKDVLGEGAACAETDPAVEPFRWLPGRWYRRRDCGTAYLLVTLTRNSGLFRRDCAGRKDECEVWTEWLSEVFDSASERDTPEVD